MYVRVVLHYRDQEALSGICLKITGDGSHVIQ
jgi:hypothetical protein